MQRFSNNARTALTTEITELATEITVNSSDDFAVLLAGEYELATIAIGSDVEIVRVTARDGNTWTVERAQEGTTAAAWPAGTTVEARVTAGALDGMMQASSVPDLVALDHGGNARGVEAVNIQTGRHADTQVAAGDYSVAIGFGSRTAVYDSTAIGPVATASAASATAIGHNAIASGVKSVCAGNDGAVASGQFGVAIGRATQATAYSSTALGNNARSTGDSATALGRDALSSGQYSVALGGGWALGGSAIAIGPDANTQAVGYNALSVMGRAFGSQSIAIKGWATAPLSIVMEGFHVIPRDEWCDQYEHGSAGARAAFCTPYVDLGLPAAWAAATTYDNGDIVRPTSGGAVQYRAWTRSNGSTGVHEAATSTATEPTWPGADDSIEIDADGNHYWIGIDWSAGYLTEEIPDGLAFFPTEIAFICHEHSTLTDTPNISIGTAAAPGLLVDADDVTITGAPQIFRFTLANPNAGIPSGTAIQIKVNTAASAGRCVGRFLLSGYFVENPTNAV